MKKLRMTTIKRKGRQLGQLALMLLMVLSLFLANVPAAMAEGDSSSPASGSPGQTASLTATEGTATLSEVIDENNSNTQSSAENFTNDLPSVTVTETFVTTDTSDKTSEYGYRPCDHSLIEDDLTDISPVHSEDTVKTELLLSSLDKSRLSIEHEYGSEYRHYTRSQLQHLGCGRTPGDII